MGASDDSQNPTVVGQPAQVVDRRPKVAGYDLIRVLGRGGMGIVWEALEHRFDRKVALKIHGSIDPENNTLVAEAFVAAKIDDPSIVRVLDLGQTLDDQPYYAMELVEGTDLATVLADGPLPPRRAVAVASDIARAAAAAHEHGVIHRDLKPRNVIIDRSGRARVLDFGIAFEMKSGDPYAGQLAGSPSYMAPEQALGRPLSPQTDIFAIGVIFYEMLTGRKPFMASTIDALLEKITSTEPPAPSSRNAELHGDLDAIVARCLAKDPAARFSSARTLFEALTAVAEGRPVDVKPGSQPRLPSRRPSTVPPSRPRREEAKKLLSWKWRLSASPAQLWPYVANTERFNKAVGLAPATFVDEAKEDGTVERHGDMRVLGMHIRWREYPFEWVKERAHSVFRWYKSGPLAALWNRVTMTPLEGGGTELVHEIWLTPRGLLGHAAAFVELDRKLAASTDRFYRHLDQIIAAGAHVDPFEAPHAATSDQRAAVDEACSNLHKDGFDARQIERLAMHLLTAPDGVVASLRPYALADGWNENREEMLDLFLHAAHLGLLEPAWDVVCPQCMLAHESLQLLAEVTKKGTCKACSNTFERDLRDTVELVFLPHPRVRKIERATYCAGAPALRPHVIAQQILDPGEKRRVKVTIPRGAYRVATGVSKQGAELIASAVGFESSVEVVATPTRVEMQRSIVQAGEVVVEFENDSDVEETIRIEVAGNRDDAVPAAAAMTHPSFRELFSQQLLAQGEHVRVSHMAFVFVSVLDRAFLFEKLGDAEALAELTRLDELVHEVVRNEDGSIVPSSVDDLVLAFASSVKAFRAALALRKRVSAATIQAEIGIAVHDGRCIALTREGKAEFFGEALHRGQALVRDCPKDGLALSPSTTADRAVAMALHESGLKETISTSSVAPYAGRRITLLEPT